MAIKINNGLGTGRKALPPRNSGMSNWSQLRLNNTIARANQQYKEALNTDGFSIYVWSRSLRGNICSCQKKTDMVKPIPTDTKTKSLKSSGSKPNDLWQIKRALPTPAQQANDFYDEIQEFNNTTGDETSSKLGREIYTTAIGEEDSGLLSIGNDRSVLFGGQDKTRCGICFGYGYVDGYSLYNGQRIVLESTKVNSISGFVSNTEKLPLSFSSPLRLDSYVEWIVELPTYYQRVMGVNIRNNLKSVEGLIAIFSIDNGITWKVLNATNIDSGFGAPQRAIIRVVVNNTTQDNIVNIDPQYGISSSTGLEYVRSATSDPIEFTHLEIFYIMGDMPKAQMPNFTRPTNFEFFDVLVQAQMEVGADISWIDREYIIGDSKHGLLWKVVDATPKLTSLRQVLGYDLSLRLVQNSEQVYLLNLLTNVNTQLAFRGIEQEQGNTVQGINVLQEPDVQNVLQTMGIIDHD